MLKSIPRINKQYIIFYETLTEKKTFRTLQKVEFYEHKKEA
jgi:hypothetical protein